MVMTRSDRENRRTQDGFVMECPVCGAYLRWVHLEASSHGSMCTFCGTTVVPTRPDGFRDLDERLVEVEDLGLIGEELEDPPSLLEPIRERRRVPGWLLALVSIIAIVGFGVWRLAASPSAPATPIHAATSPSAPVQPSPATKGASKQSPITRITATIQFDSPTWIEVTGDGQRLASTTYQPQRLVFHARHDLLVWLGHGSGVTLTVDGKNVSLGSNSTKLTMTLRNGRVSVTQA
ncbi:MAG TPA: RodZ domain-containing protein [Actinomycetota bacterium]